MQCSSNNRDSIKLPPPYVATSRPQPSSLETPITNFYFNHLTSSPVYPNRRFGDEKANGIEHVGVADFFRVHCVNRVQTSHDHPAAVCIQTVLRELSEHNVCVVVPVMVMRAGGGQKDRRRGMGKKRIGKFLENSRTVGPLPPNYHGNGEGGRGGGGWQRGMGAGRFPTKARTFSGKISDCWSNCT